ncbi:VirB4-like conjugal transfer ATPase, CD1110 family [Butyrivibrio sp. YAB3001]|uniref:VirB4-like conjugal transfer ATPase, CD1110 family n=1 Tax=Butyrivibrio sp. YAB3001 TaxID=1520812 RepID=UPI0008F66EFB|nr:AAA-like domain-containing protein [Butyrivibrio sp. YAB3001]
MIDFTSFFRKNKKEYRIPSNLSRKDRRRVERIIKKAQKNDGIPRTAQQTIPFQRMFQDGICRVGKDFYTKTIEFQDINYQLALPEDQTSIFGEWCGFLNYFDSSVSAQISFMNMATDADLFKKSIAIEHTKDKFNSVRDEYSGVIFEQMQAGNNGLYKVKYLTFGIHADSLKTARPRLIHLEMDILNNFKRIGVVARTLNGKERLGIMHSIFHIGEDERFHFDWNWLTSSGLSVKDFIAPSSFYFKNGRTFKIGNTYGAMSFLAITASDISDQLLSDILKMESSQIVTMHIQTIDQNEAIKTVKHTITELDRSKIEEQKKAVRSGYDMDIIPSDLATYGKDAKALLKELQSQNERMFLLTFTIMNTGSTLEQLENNVFQASSIAQKHNCQLVRLDFQQEQGLMSALPLASNQIDIKRGLTTSSTAIFIPFTTQELFQSGKESLYYGLNALSNNLIMVDRKLLKNPNGLILGTPGSGKSFAAKREIANAFLVTDDDIIICDPESEYSALVKRFEGQVIKIAPTSKHYINPMDINMNYSDDDNPISLKTEFILSLCELIMGGKDGLKPVERTVIDRCVRIIYNKYFENPVPERMPLLEDLYNALLEQDEPEAHHVAKALEIYVKGSLNVFNHRTNVDITNRIVCYDIKDLGNQLKKIGMLIVQDQVWGRVTKNRSQGRSTRYYMDELHLLLREEQTAAYTVEIWKRFRKWGGMPTGITQNVKDLLASKEVENIFENSDFILMLNQAAGDRQILSKQLNISPHQLSYVTHSGEGEGLLFYGNVILPFIDRFPQDTELYHLLTTKLNEVVEAQNATA